MSKKQKEQKIEELADAWAETAIRMGEAAKVEFVKSLDRDPLYAIEWANIEPFARMRVARFYQERRKKGAPGWELMTGFRYEAFRMSRWPKKSTSAIMNEANVALMSAYAEFVADVDPIP